MRTDPDRSAAWRDSPKSCAHASAAGAPQNTEAAPALGHSRGGFGALIPTLADRRGRSLAGACQAVARYDNTPIVSWVFRTWRRPGAGCNPTPTRPRPPRPGRAAGKRRCPYSWQPPQPHPARPASGDRSGCALYAPPPLAGRIGPAAPAQAWIRHERPRSGWPLAQSNEACGAANAPTRKDLTQRHSAYFPSLSARVRLAAYRHPQGRPTKRPCFSRDGSMPLTAAA